MLKLASFTSAVVLSFAVPAAAAVDDCIKEAEAHVNRSNHKDGGNVSSGMFLDADSPPETRKLNLKVPCLKGACRQFYYSIGEPAIEAPAGFEAEPDYRTSSALHWGTIPRATGAKCEALHVLKFKPKAQETNRTPDTSSASPNPLIAPPSATPKTEPILLAGVKLEDDLATYKSRNSVRLTNEATLGISQSLEGAASETIQILGQIVADRASAEAYRLLKDRLEELLGCGAVVPLDSGPSAPTSKKFQVAADTALPPKKDAPPSSPRVSESSGDSKGAQLTLPKPSFPMTCKVLTPLRLQDVAMSRDSLFAAFAADSIAYLESMQKILPEGVKTAEKIGAAALVASVVVPLIVRPKLLADNEPARVLVETILAHVKTLDGANLRPAQAALAAGVLGYVKCVESTQTDSRVSLANCDFGRFTDQYAGTTNAAVRLASRSLAAKLITVATLDTPDGKADVRRRVMHAVDAVFGSSCMLVQDEEAPSLACPPAPDSIDGKVTSVDVLAFLQPIVDAALEGDSNALVVAIAHPVQVFFATMAKTANDDDKPDLAKEHLSRRRAFMLMASLIEYSVTFAQPDPNQSAQQLHEQRTKMLESLTKDMSDRTARDGDDIWSFGGSLRFQGGVHASADGAALWGPLGLPLGIGFDHVAQGRAGGIHLEFSPIDIGQYVSFDKQATVKTPELADAFAPNFTLAVGWGKSIPLILGGTVGYSPTLKVSSTSSTSKGVFNAGVVLGMYVPLIDMN